MTPWTQGDTNDLQRIIDELEVAKNEKYGKNKPAFLIQALELLSSLVGRHLFRRL